MNDTAIGNLRDEVADGAISEETDWVEDVVYMQDEASKQQR